MNCATCKHYNAVRETVGQRRRYPPQVVIHTEEVPSWKEDVWPEVYGDEWCGEFVLSQTLNTTAQGEQNKTQTSC